VQRERDAFKVAPDSAGDPVRHDLSSSDLFEWEQHASSRIPNAVDAFAVRVSFIAETVTLRVLLNRLDEFEVPLVVRGVEVEPASKPERQPGPADVKPDEPAPLVAKSLSRFTVTVEWIGAAKIPESNQGT
jgi:hypothetical protein